MELDNKTISDMQELLLKKQDQLIKQDLRKRFLNLNLYLAKEKPTIELNMYTK